MRNLIAFLVYILLVAKLHQSKEKINPKLFVVFAILLFSIGMIAVAIVTTASTAITLSAFLVYAFFIAMLYKNSERINSKLFIILIILSLAIPIFVMVASVWVFG